MLRRGGSYNRTSAAGVPGPLEHSKPLEPPVQYLLVGVGSVFFVEDGAAAASWPPAGRFRGTPACLWVVPRYVPAWVAAGSIAATRNLMAAAASANCAVLVRHACDVPVRASLHVG